MMLYTKAPILAPFAPGAWQNATATKLHSLSALINGMLKCNYTSPQPQRQWSEFHRSHSSGQSTTT